MKEILKKSLKIYYLMFIANIMSLLLVFSFGVISVVGFTEEIGYTVYGVTEENTEQIKLYTHYFSDGEDTKKQEYTDMGYTLSTVSLRSNPTKTADTVFKAVAGVITIIILLSFMYNEMWKFGDNERTNVKYRGHTEQKNKGFIIGLIATVPSFLLFAVFTVLKSSVTKSVSLKIYGFLNPYLHNFIQIITNGSLTFGDIKFWQILVILLLLSLVPVACGISYLLGYNEISIGEKFVYKKTKE